MSIVFRNKKSRHSLSVVILTMLILFAFTNEIFLKPVKAANDKRIQKIYKQSWLLLSKMHKNIKGLHRAIVELNEALKLDPDNSDTYWRLAEITFKKADDLKDDDLREKLYHKTISYCRTCLKLKPDSLEAHYWTGCTTARLAEMAGIFSAKGLLDKAKASLRETIKINPDHRFSVLARVIMAALYSETPWPLKDLELAEKYALKATKMDSKLTIASVNLGRVYVRDEKFILARKELQRCLGTKDARYVWDAILYDWPLARELLKEIEDKE